MDMGVMGVGVDDVPARVLGLRLRRLMTVGQVVVVVIVRVGF